MLTVLWNINSARSAGPASIFTFLKILLTNKKKFKKEMQIYLQFTKAVSEILKRVNFNAFNLSNRRINGDLSVVYNRAVWVFCLNNRKLNFHKDFCKEKVMLIFLQEKQN